MKRTALLRKTPLARSGFKPRSLVKPSARGDGVTVKVWKSLRTKQRAVTAEEKHLWSRMANEVGCIACLIDGVPNTYVSIHHVDGRTKPGCHKKVLPLCGPHHQQDDTDAAGRIAVHPNTARFEARYGTQEELMMMAFEILEKEGMESSGDATTSKTTNNPNCALAND